MPQPCVAGRRLRGLSATGYRRLPHAPTLHPQSSHQSGRMFLFFSNKLGCVGSILVSLAGTVLLLLLLALVF